MTSREVAIPEQSQQCATDLTSAFVPARERVDLAVLALREAMASCAVMREFRMNASDERSASASNVLALRIQQLLEVSKALLEDENYPIDKARETVGGA